jgi:hypothetical protein
MGASQRWADLLFAAGTKREVCGVVPLFQVLLGIRHPIAYDD